VGARLLNAKKKARRRAHKQARANQTIQAAGIGGEHRDGRIAPRLAPNGGQTRVRG